MKADLALKSYLREAASWDQDRLAQTRRSERVAWWVAAAGWVCAVAGAGSLPLLLPLKRVEPFVIRVDNSSGVVDVVPAYAGHASLDEAVTRYFVTHYVTVCERFHLATAESDYEECGAFHAPQRNQVWAALWSRNNPASPLNVHKDGSSSRAQVESVSFLRPASGSVELAQVRYAKADSLPGQTVEHFTHWIATIQYAYTEPSTDPKTRRWNPLGFKVVEFVAEPEITVGAIPPLAAESRSSR